MYSTWLVNTSLTKLDPEECQGKQQGKLSKALFSAYQIAAEGHDLDYYKQILKDFQEEQRVYEEEQAKLEAEQAEADAKKAETTNAPEADGKEKKKKARKSKGGADEDIEMADAEQIKPSKKRKNDSNDGDADGAKVRLNSLTF